MLHLHLIPPQTLYSSASPSPSLPSPPANPAPPPPPFSPEARDSKGSDLEVSSDLERWPCRAPAPASLSPAPAPAALTPPPSHPACALQAVGDCVAGTPLPPAAAAAQVSDAAPAGREGEREREGEGEREEGGQAVHRQGGRLGGVI